MVIKYQMEGITEIKDYIGENIKVFCDRIVIFTFDVENELAEITDEVCKLHMDADCIVI